MVFRFKKLGRGTVIKPFPRTIIGADNISIGEECFFAEGLVIAVTQTDPTHTATCVIGDRCNFGYDAFISCTHSVIIGNDVLTSARIFIGDSYHGYSRPELPVKEQPMEGAAPVVIGDGSFLGIGSAVLAGVTLGRNCVVAANAVVTKSFPDYSVIAGIPAKLIRRYDTVSRTWVAGENSP